MLEGMLDPGELPELAGGLAVAACWHAAKTSGATKATAAMDSLERRVSLFRKVTGNSLSDSQAVPKAQGRGPAARAKRGHEAMGLLRRLCVAQPLQSSRN